jgi:hypothetical protein
MKSLSQTVMEYRFLANSAYTFTRSCDSCPPSCSQSMVRLQQTTQTLNADNLGRFFNRGFRLNDSI